MSNPSTDENQVVQSESGPNKKENKKERKKLLASENRNDKAFMDMLRTVSRNHYTLNQMVDRKARILLSANVLIVTVIVGYSVTQSPSVIVNPLAILVLGTTALSSMVLSLLAVIPEKSRGKLNAKSLKDRQGNPLFFGNFVRMPQLEFEDSMLKMASDRDSIYRAMIQDTYHLGKMLESKRKVLRNSLFTFVGGLSVSFIIVCVQICSAFLAVAA